MADDVTSSALDEAVTRIGTALDVITTYGGYDGEHHKQWVLDQVVRALTGCGSPDGSEHESDDYLAWRVAYADGEDGPDTYAWDEGIAP